MTSSAAGPFLRGPCDAGLPTDRQCLFVIDGAKALRAAIGEVFGADQPVQRCRDHKMRNVLDELPKEQHPQALNLMRAAWRLSDEREGMKPLKQPGTIPGAGARASPPTLVDAQPSRLRSDHR